MVIKKRFEVAPFSGEVEFCHSREDGNPCSTNEPSVLKSGPVFSLLPNVSFRLLLTQIASFAVKLLTLLLFGKVSVQLIENRQPTLWIAKRRQRPEACLAVKFSQGLRGEFVKQLIYANLFVLSQRLQAVVPVVW